MRKIVNGCELVAFNEAEFNEVVLVGVVVEATTGACIVVVDMMAAKRRAQQSHQTFVRCLYQPSEMTSRVSYASSGRFRRVPTLPTNFQQLS